MDDRSETTVRPRPLIGRLVAPVLVVVLCAAIASGSCAGYVSVDAIEEGEKSVSGAIVLPVLLSAGLASAVGFLFFYIRPVQRWPEAKIFATVGVAAYVAGMLGAWYPLLVPAGIALIVIIAGGLVAGWMGRDSITRFSWSAALISGVAIALATFGFVVGFWANYEFSIGWFDGGGYSRFNPVPFALVAGSVPPIAAVIAARLTGRAGASGRALPEQYAPAFPGHSQPSAVELGFLIASVSLCAAIAMGLGLIPTAHWWTGYLELPLRALIAGATLRVLFAAVVAFAVGVLFVVITPDRREVWFFAIVGIGVYIAGTLGTQLVVFGDPWLIVTSLVIVAISAGAVGYAARRKFDAGAGSAVIAGAIALIGALASAFLVAGAYGYVSVPFGHSPLFVGGAPTIVAAISAFICGNICRTSR